MDTILYSLNAVLPILLLVGLGYFLKRVHFLDADFLTHANRFVFRIALPTLLFVTIYQIDQLNDINWPMVLFAVGGILFLFVLGLLFAFVFIKDPKQKGVLVQGVFRSNYAIIGIPLAQAIGGFEAVANVALVSAIAVPLMNILSVVSLTMFVEDHQTPGTFRKTLVKVITNPLIIAVFLGLAALWIRSWIPIDSTTGLPVFTIEHQIPFLYLAITWVGQIASPLALIVLGGTFEFFVIKDLKRQIILGVLARNLMAPALTLTLAVLMTKWIESVTLGPDQYPALIALFASPTAVASAIMAAEMDNDKRLAVQLVVWTTTLSVVTIFFTVFVFRSLSLI
ncbi:MAG: AEC family transporter [Candidatus Izemoplasmatales bacterium]|nr:AEC family transporter [Candidatus Izemoplasmatales bacterium]